MNRWSWSPQFAAIVLLFVWLTGFVLHFIFPQSGFSGNISTDGFASQLYAVSTFKVHHMIVPHIFRFIAFSPFWLANKLALPLIFEYVLLSIVAFPIIRGEKNNITKITLMVTMVFFSFLVSHRTSLAMYGFFYLFVWIRGRSSYWMLIGSLLFCNLSSGLLLAWVITLTCYLPKLLKSHSRTLLLAIYTFGVLLALNSIFSKLINMYGLVGPAETVPMSESTAEGFFDILSILLGRSNIVDALNRAQILTLLKNLILLASVIFSLILLAFRRKYREPEFFFLTLGLSFFAVEGLGAFGITLIAVKVLTEEAQAYFPQGQTT